MKATRDSGLFDREDLKKDEYRTRKEEAWPTRLRRGASEVLVGPYPVLVWLSGYKKERVRERRKKGKGEEGFDTLDSKPSRIDVVEGRESYERCLD